MLNEALTKALNNVPNRTVTGKTPLSRRANQILAFTRKAGALVRSYLQKGNPQYYAIHPPTFLHQYEAWWTTRQHAQDFSPAFTALLL